MLYRRHGEVRKELGVKTPFQAVEKRFCLKTPIKLSGKFALPS
jgi:hypothetical protein